MQLYKISDLKSDEVPIPYLKTLSTFGKIKSVATT